MNNDNQTAGGLCWRECNFMSDDVYLIASISNCTHVLRLLNIIFFPLIEFIFRPGVLHKWFR